ncbi:MAG: iron-sulfur cluster assembly scaffold protein [Candidatus Micrarchaeota archaeon]|nr:MAG: iron-sulfur cluster assembly scaffold protein [Candidatus Micrarchaeota archaeon]
MEDSDDEIKKLYAEAIISYYEHPHNKRKLESADAEFKESNPVCGDVLTVYIKVKDKKIEDISFEGQGCAISIGSASIFTDFAKGKDIELIRKFSVKELIDLIKIDPGPVRLNCATLILRATQKALSKYKG